MLFYPMPSSHLTIYLEPYLLLEPDMLWHAPSHAAHSLACNSLCFPMNLPSCVLITPQFASSTDPIDPMALMSRTLSHGQPIGFLVRPPTLCLVSLTRQCINMHLSLLSAPLGTSPTAIC